MLLYIDYNYNRCENSSIPRDPTRDINNQSSLRQTTTAQANPTSSSIHCHCTTKSNHHHQFTTTDHHTTKSNHHHQTKFVDIKFPLS